mmetsp:Transcript_39332/g.98962  ORF Transcript_39332/g.98962 Transcript_39332/m.98962 type:complete len:371 (+) Transcript_39332:267-1379(+)
MATLAEAPLPLFVALRIPAAAALALAALLFEAVAPGLVIDQALVVLDSLRSPVGERERQPLQRGRLDMLHEQVLRGLIPERSDLLLDHHLRHDRMHNLGRQIEHTDQLIQVERVIYRGVREQVGSQALGLDLFLDHVPHLGSIVWMPDIDVLPKLQVLNRSASALPIALLESLRCADDSLLGVLRWPCEDLLVVLIQCAPEHTRDDPLVGRVDRLHGQVGHLQKHRTEVVCAVEHLQIDVHVVRKLPQSLRALLLRSPVCKLGIRQALCQELPGLVVHAYSHQVVVRFLDFAKTEGAQAHLSQDAVVENLNMDVRLQGLLLEIGEVQQITCLLEVVVKSQVVGLAEERTPLIPRLASGKYVPAELAHEGT